MSDLIDRQAAINAIKSDLSPIIDTYDLYRVLKMACIDRAVRKVEQVPSAQPELDEWCTDCSEYDSEKHCCPRWNRVIRNTLKDAEPFISDDGTVMISVPKGQLDKVGRVIVTEESTKYCKMMYEPERKKGKWVDLWDSADPDTSHSCRCSECKRKSLRPVGNFCKWCGADMRGE